MPLHDWTRVDVGTFHGFHTAWLTHLSEALNGGLLPKGYYALPEQHGSNFIVDVLTLHASYPAQDRPLRPENGGLAVADRPPQVQLHRQGIHVSFWDYCKVGVPLTILTLALGIAWLQFVRY